MGQTILCHRSRAALRSHFVCKLPRHQALAGRDLQDRGTTDERENAGGIARAVWNRERFLSRRIRRGEERERMALRALKIQPTETCKILISYLNPVGVISDGGLRLRNRTRGGLPMYVFTKQQQLRFFIYIFALPLTP